MHTLLGNQLVNLPPELDRGQVTGFHKGYDAGGTDVQRLSPTDQISVDGRTGIFSASCGLHSGRCQSHQTRPDRHRYHRLARRRENLLPEIRRQGIPRETRRG